MTLREALPAPKCRLGVDALRLPDRGAECGRDRRAHTLWDRLFWSAYATVYDALPRSYRPYGLQLQRVVELIGERYRPGSCRILDAGCGTGTYVKALRQNGYDVVGVDSAAWMLSRAHSKLSQFEGGEPGMSEPACMLTWADLSRPLPFDAEVFDCVISINALYMLPQPESALADFSRVLRPGGTLLLSHPQRIPALRAILVDHARRFGLLSVVRPLGVFLALGLFNWCIAKNFATGRYTTWSRDQMRQELMSAGFQMQHSECAYACNSNLLVCASKK